MPNAPVKNSELGGLVGAVGIELVGQSLSLAESTALTPLQPSKTALKHHILDTSWPRRSKSLSSEFLSPKSTKNRW